MALARMFVNETAVIATSGYSSAGWMTWVGRSRDSYWSKYKVPFDAIIIGINLHSQTDLPFQAAIFRNDNIELAPTITNADILVSGEGYTAQNVTISGGDTMAMYVAAPFGNDYPEVEIFFRRVNLVSLPFVSRRGLAVQM
jgi:hypothetical protein